MVKTRSQCRLGTRSIGVGTDDRSCPEDDSVERLNQVICNLESELARLRDELDSIKNVIGQGQGDSDVCQGSEIMLNNSDIVRGISDRVLILGDSLFKYSASYVASSGFKSWYFPGVRFEQLADIVEGYVGGGRDLVFVHVGTHNIYDASPEIFRWKFDRLVNCLRDKFNGAKFIFNGIVYRRDVDFRRIDWANDILSRVCSQYGCTFKNPNSYLNCKDLGRNGINLNRSGSYKLGKVCVETILENQKN